MEEQKFKHLLEETKIKKSVSTSSTETAYLTGYEKGLRRLFHGVNFGTQGHKILLGCFGENSIDGEKATGYLDALLLEGLFARDVKVITKMSEQTIRQWAKNNNLEKKIVESNFATYFFTKEDFENFLNRNTKRGKPRKEK